MQLMYLLRKKNHLCLLLFGFCLSSKPCFALEFQSGVGIGAEYTNNATLSSGNENNPVIDDVITTGNVSANIAEDQGPLTYGADAGVRREVYLNNTFEKRTYFNLGAQANWEMLRERFNWFLSDQFSQRPVISTGADTPDNRQDSNVFIFGADIKFPVAQRQLLSIKPQYNRYYYEQATNNRQYSLAANWNYQMFRLTGVGLIFDIRNIVYDGSSIQDTLFTRLGFIVSAKRVSSNYTINLGTTNVERENGQETTGFSGSANLATELSSRSTMGAIILTELTDSSTVSQSTSPGNPDDVQLSATDVIRNSLLRLTYDRADAALHSRLWGEYRELKYSDNTVLSRTVQSFGAVLGFPVTQLVSSGVSLNFSSVKRLENPLEDRRFNIGANVNVIFTSKLSSSFKVQYRTRESSGSPTASLRNYDELSIFASLNYGLGDARGRSTGGH